MLFLHETRSCALQEALSFWYTLWVLSEVSFWCMRRGVVLVQDLTGGVVLVQDLTGGVVLVHTYKVHRKWKTREKKKQEQSKDLSEASM